MARRSRLIRVVLLSAAIGGGVSLSASQNAASTRAAGGPDVTKLGPQQGQKVPDFTLPDQDGRARSLASLMGDNGLVLVFSRSADW
ncbi:MAG TPA: hypothetical protein VJ813_14960 [Vicinamibacterales bacterium]|nr:hypothetical protein [Vicinamibacterales bacterium]